MIEANIIIAISIVLFFLGTYGILTRKNFLIIFMCSEIIIAASTLNFLALSKDFVSYSFIIFSWIISIADTLIAVSLFIYLLKHNKTVDIDKFEKLKW